MTCENCANRRYLDRWDIPTVCSFCIKGSNFKPLRKNAVHGRVSAFIKMSTT